MSLLSDNAFDLIRARTRLKPESKGTQAAKMVMVYGYTPANAAKAQGITRSGVNNTTARMKKEMEKTGLCPCCGAIKPVIINLG